MKKILFLVFILITLKSFSITIGYASNVNDKENGYLLEYYNNELFLYTAGSASPITIDGEQLYAILNVSSNIKGYISISSLISKKYQIIKSDNYYYYNLNVIYKNLLNDRQLLDFIIKNKDVNFSSFYGIENNAENLIYDSNGNAVGFYSSNGKCIKPENEEVFYLNGEKAFFSTETDENGNLIYKIITSDTSKELIHSFADQLKKLAENTEIRLFAAVMVVVGGFVAFRMVKRGLNWLKMEPYYSDLDKAYDAYKKGEVGDFTLNKALGRDYKRYKMKNSQWHYGKNGRVVFDNTDGVMSFREFSKNRLKDRWKYKNQYDAKKNEGFKKYVDKKQKIEDLEFKRLPDEQLSSEDYRKKYEKEINGFLLHHMNNYRSYDETFLRKEYMEKGIYNEETEAEIQNMLNIIEEENRKSDQVFFDKQEQIYNESPIDSMEWHYPISEA